jgi:hypothetical protein
VGVSAGLALGFFFCPCLGDACRNDWNCWRLAREVSGIPHPPGTSALAARREVGLFGNGNHCDFFAGELRRFEGGREEIERFYRSVTVQNPVSGERVGVRVAFFREGYADDQGLPGDHYKLVTWGVHGGFGGYYVVFVFDPGYNPGCDLRCI